jgi:hypothetical protein
MKQQTKASIQFIIDKISYKDDWKFYLDERDGGFLLQIKFNDIDVESGKVELQSCRKWYLSSWSTDTEVVRTAYKAVCAAEDHERDEKFRYHGVQVFNPHIDIFDVVAAMQQGDIGLDART